MNESADLLLTRKGIPLNDLLKCAYYDELSAITIVILNSNSDRLLHDAEPLKILEKHRETGELYKVTDLLADEICHFGSNTLASKWRDGKPVDYSEVVRDVAKEQKITISANDVEADIEKKILMSFLKQNSPESTDEDIKKLIEEDAEDLGIKIIGSASSDTKKTSGIGFATGAASAFAFAFGLVPAALAFAAKKGYEKSRPSLEVVFPVVVYIAAIRQRLIQEDKNKFLSELRACL